jgi:hypothetical protein
MQACSVECQNVVPASSRSRIFQSAGSPRDAAALRGIVISNEGGDELQGRGSAITNRRDDRSLLDFTKCVPGRLGASAEFLRPLLLTNRRNRRASVGRYIRHERNGDACAEGFAREIPAFLRRALPAETVIQLFFRL